MRVLLMMRARRARGANCSSVGGEFKNFKKLPLLFLKTMSMSLSSVVLDEGKPVPVTF